MAKSGKEKGFILITILFLLLLVAVTAMSLNFKSGLQARMAANRTDDAQTYLDQLAVIEQSLWKLTGDPCWRVSAGEDYTYQGITYNRKVFSPDAVIYPALTSYKDAVIISVRAPNASRPVNTSFRYNIDTVAGTGLSPQGMATYYDAVLKTLFLYIADSANHCIQKLDTSTNVIEPVAGTTGLSSPQGVATYYDSVQMKLFLYIADSGNHRIYKLDTATNAISIVVNTSGTQTDATHLLGDNGTATAATLNSPEGIFVNASGDIYIADTNNHRIRVVRNNNNKINTVAGTGTAGYFGDGGNAASAQINTPQGVFINTSNDLYIADTNNHRIRVVRNSNNIISTVAGTGTAGYLNDGGLAKDATLNSPTGVSVDTAGNIYIADTGNHCMRIVNHDLIPIISTMVGDITTVPGTVTSGYNGDNRPAVQAQLSSPGGVALGLQKAGGRIFISDTGNNRVRVLFLKTEPKVYGPLN